MADLSSRMEVVGGRVIVSTNRRWRLDGRPEQPLCAPQEHAGREASELAGPDLSEAVDFDAPPEYFAWVMREMPAEGLVIAAGVRRGDLVNFFADRLAARKDPRPVHGFDAFDRNWTGIALPTDAVSDDGLLPEVCANVRLTRGWIPDTIGPFLAEHPDVPLAFLHVDTDTYLSARCLLSMLKPRLQPGTIICFDALIGHPSWKVHAYRALNEVLAPEGYSYIALTGRQAAIRIR